MSTLFQSVLREAATDLTDAGVDFAVVGGVAVGAHAVLRYTQDIDLAVAVSDDRQAKSVGAFLIRRGYRPMTEIDQTAVDRLATLRLLSHQLPADLDPTEAPLLDIIFASCGIEAELVSSAEPIEILPGITLPTTRIPHLIAMKLLSESDERPIDRSDLQALIGAATDADLAEIPPLLDLIIDRGYARDKDLPALFARHLERRRW
jgi:hypothetical protein